MKQNNISKSKNILLIVGATAVGKTNVAIHFAKKFNTKIISCDSRQCFKELNIGVAKPSIAELNEAEHFFINSHSINEDVNAGIFEKYALEKANEIFKVNDIAVMVGGTGLYANAFCNGIDEMPVIDESIRSNIIKLYSEKGIGWLQNEVKTKDAVFWANAEQQNPQRLMRALEVIESTGKSIIEFKTNKKAERRFNVIKIGLHLPKEKLVNRINERVDIMVKDGLLEEVESLLKHQHLNALQTVGYKELFAYFDGKILKEKVFEQIKIHTRQYAKRQMTWFKKDEEIEWFSPYDLTGIEEYIQSKTKD